MAMTQEQMKIWESFFKNTETIFRWCISQGPVRKRKLSLDIFNKRNLVQGINYTRDRGTERTRGDSKAFQRLKKAGSCYHPQAEGTAGEVVIRPQHLELSDGN